MMKSNFPVFYRYPKLIYLDSAASTLKPIDVIEALTEFYSYHYANIYRGTYKLSEEATDMYEKSKETVARFLSVEPDQIAFVKNATEALNIAIHAVSKRPPFNGGWLSYKEHHSVFVPFLKHMKYVEFGEEINKNYPTIALTHASNVLGDIPNLKMARENANILIVDGTQYVQHKRPNLPSFDPDFYAFSGHKIFGPSGIGVLYVKDPTIWEPLTYGGGAVENVSFYEASVRTDISKFEAGTPPIAEAWGLKVAIEFFLRYEDEIHSTDTYLTHYMKKRLEEEKIPGLVNTNPDIPIFSFYWSELHAHDVATLLSERHIAIRSGYHCAQPLHNYLNIPPTFRASLSIYNTKDDVDKFVEALKVVRNAYIR